MWMGLVLGVLFVALGLSGSVLVYNDAIDRLTAPMPRASASGTPQPLDNLIAAARAAAPAAQGPVFLELPKRPGDPAVVRFFPAAGAPASANRDGRRAGRIAVQGGEIFVDPVTAKVLGSRISVMSPIVAIAHDLHGNLFLGASGRPYVGWLGIAMLVLGLTGLVLWWPRSRQWKSAFVVRRAARGLRFYRELHGAAGIWGFVVFIIVSFTGVGMVFSDTIRGALSGGASPASNVSALSQIDPNGNAPIGADVAVALARKALPHDQVVSIMLRPAQAISVTMRPDDGSPILALVYVDPYRAKVTAVRDRGTLSDAETFLAWQKPLHVGDGLGPVWRFFVFLSGFLPLLFVVTGVVMWLTKRRNRMAMNQPLPE